MISEPVEARQEGQAHTPAPAFPRRRQGVLATYFTPKEPIPRHAVVILGVLSFALPLALWSLVSYFDYNGVASTDILPTPTTVLGELRDMFFQNGFASDMWASSYRILLGFAISAVVGVPLGILMGSFRTVQALFEPLISFSRYLPASAFIPLLILWVGYADGEKVAIIIIGSFFQLCLLIADISAGVQKELLQIAYTLGASRRQVFTRVLIPASLPGVVDTLRIIIGWAWTYLIVAELVGAESGIGHVIVAAQRNALTEEVIAGILSIGVLGVITDALFRLLHRALFPYVERAGGTANRARSLLPPLFAGR